VRSAGCLAVLTSVAILGLAACTQAPEAAPAPTDGPVPTTTSTSTSTSGTQTPTTATTTTDEGLLGTLIRVVFPSLPAQWVCSDQVVAGTDSTVLTIERLQTLRVCFEGFGTDAPPSLVVTTPNGHEVPISLAGRSWLIDADLVAGPTTEPGSYTFRVEDPAGPASVATGRLDLVPASEARIRLSQGATLGVQLAGFAPSTDVRMAAYVARTDTQFEPNYDLFEQLPTGHTDAAGELATTWAVPSSAEPGLYVLWTDPGPSHSQCQDVGCTGFAVSGP
jgi:hypothetical protein